MVVLAAGVSVGERIGSGQVSIRGDEILTVLKVVAFADRPRRKAPRKNCRSEYKPEGTGSLVSQLADKVPHRGWDDDGRNTDSCSERRVRIGPHVRGNKHHNDGENPEHKHSKHTKAASFWFDRNVVSLLLFQTRHSYPVLQTHMIGGY